MFTTKPLPLAQRLALVITTVIVFALMASLLLTYDSFARSTEAQMGVRLRGATRQLSASASTSATARHATLMRFAVRDMLRGAVTADALSPAARQALLDELTDVPRSQADPTAPVELWSADGHRVAAVGTDVGEPAGAHAASGFPVRRPGLSQFAAGDTAVTGALFVAEGGQYFWSAVAVRDGARVVGYLAQRLRSASPPGVMGMLRDLTGEDVRLRMGNRDGSGWVSDGGVADATRSLADTTAVAIEYEGPEGMMLGVAMAVDSTPWIAVTETPLAGVRARSKMLLASTGALALFLALLGGVISFFIGRRIAKPLVRMADAAESFAHGDFSQRLPVRGGDEVTRLATSFNRMAGEIEAGQHALEQRVAEARAAAVQMEDANERLQRTMAEADRAREDAQQANRAKSDFLAVMSHELRTPLNAIGGYAQLLEIGVHGPVTPAQLDALRRIGRSQAHLLRLINDVLNFAQIDSGHVRYTMHDVPLDETLAGLEALVAPQLQAKGLAFTYGGCAPDVTVHADGDKISQIVLNLLTNAIKFTPRGGHVAVRCEPGDTAIHVRVQDTGVGIPAERLDAIFDPFVQLDRTVHRTVEGVGLGLAISRDLARGMGGELSATSDVGVGSTFTLTLPLHATRPSPATTPADDATRKMERAAEPV